MASTDEEYPKCGLLAILPKPKGPTIAAKGGAKQKIQAGVDDANGPNSTAIPARQLFAALKPRQIPSKQPPTATHSKPPMKPKDIYKTKNSDSDDEEFEQKMSQTRPIGIHGQTPDGESDSNDEDEDGAQKEGPAKPSVSNHIQKQQVASKEPEKPRILVNRPLLGFDYGSDDSEEEEDADETEAKKVLPVDFFGLNTTKMDNEEGHMDAETAHQEPAIFIGDVAPGPARPTKRPISQMEEEQLDSGSTSAMAPMRPISDQEASRMIYEKEMVPFGLSTVHANDAVSGIIDVSVDAALGPNVHQNLLRNLNNKQMAQIALGPLPKMRKNEADKLAKRKHQITHLANVAITREEELQEKWAEGKQTKKMSRQKYGF